jgi:hypothetical protein
LSLLRIGDSLRAKRERVGAERGQRVEQLVQLDRGGGRNASGDAIGIDFAPGLARRDPPVGINRR